MKRVLSVLAAVALLLTLAPVPSRAADPDRASVFVAPADGTYSLFEAGKPEPTATTSGLAGELLTLESSMALSVSGQGWTISAPHTDRSAAWAVVTFALPCPAESVTVSAGSHTVTLAFASAQSRGRVLSVAYPVVTGAATTLRIDGPKSDPGAGVCVLTLTGVRDDRLTLRAALTPYGGAAREVSVGVEVYGSARYAARWAEGRRTAGCSDWAPENLRSALLLGLVPGDLAGDWKKPVTRLEFCRQIVRALESLTGKSADALMAAKGVAINPSAFSDTSNYAALVCHALGIVSGNGDGTFAPDGTLNRAYAAGFLKNIAQFLGEDTSAAAHGFTDKSIAPWMNPSINYVKAKGIMIGNGNGTFSPLDTFTREQATTALLNFTIYYFWRAYGSQANAVRARMFKNGDYLSFPYDGAYKKALEASAGIVELVNAERASAGISPLVRDLPLTVISMLKCMDMRERGYFEHESPTYGQVWNMMSLFGIDYSRAGENIASGFVSPEAVMDGWMRSDGHRANILDSRYTRMGAGVSWSSDAVGTLWSQSFWG